jgi:hypothetical protein
MDTRDWAEEAHAWFESYHEAIVVSVTATNDSSTTRVEQDVVSSPFFGNLTVGDVLWNRFTSNPVLMGGANNTNKNINIASDNDKNCHYATHFLLDWKAHDYDLLEQDRGWQPLLRSLPKVEHYRLLTLIRRNLLKPLQDVSNQTLVSRHQWVLIEGLRWKAGLYERADVLNVIQQHSKNILEKSSLIDQDSSCPSNTFKNSTACHSSSLEVCTEQSSSNGEEEDGLSFGREHLPPCQETCCVKQGHFAFHFITSKSRMERCRRVFTVVDNSNLHQRRRHRP